MNCEFCNKEFSSKGNLNYHQKTAKFCINLRQNKENKENIENNNFICEYCKNSFYRKNNLQKHLIICKEKKNFEYQKQIENEVVKKITIEMKDNYENQIKELKQQIEDLQNKNQELAIHAIDKPSIINHNKNDITNNNNILNNIGNLNLDNNSLEDTFMNSMTIQHVIDGQAGVANLLHRKFLIDDENKPLAICTDKSRQVIKYKEKQGNIVKDPKGYHLASKVYAISEQAALKVRDNYLENVYNAKPDQNIKIEDITEIEPEEKIVINRRSEVKLRRLLAEKMNVEMDPSRINGYPDNEEQDREWNYRLERIKSKTLGKPRKWKKRKEPENSTVRYYCKWDKSVPPEDPLWESDWDDVAEEEDEEFNSKNGQEDYKIYCRLQDIKKEKNEERLNELKRIVEAKGWNQEKKDYYLKKINLGLEDIRLLKVDTNKFGKALSMALPS